MKSMKTIIVAYDKNFGIGANNDLLWQRDLPADLKHFKDATMGGAIIMGFNTYKSIGRPLPGRQNIVISDKNDPIDGYEVASSLQSAYEIAESDKETFVIGGGQIYALAMDTVDRILATEVDAIFDQATIFFPEINTDKWREVEREKHRKYGANLYNYDFVIYERI
jgi:dihydrofolate reductase